MTRLTYNCAHLRLNNKKNKNKLSQNQVSCHLKSFPEEFFLGEMCLRPSQGLRGLGGAEGASGAEGAEEVDQGEVSTIILGMLESSEFRTYSTLLVIQLFSRRLCLCHCLCVRLCLCIGDPYSFLNSYYHKLSENVWVWGSGASRSEI